MSTRKLLKLILPIESLSSRTIIGDSVDEGVARGAEAYDDVPLHTSLHLQPQTITVRYAMTNKRGT